MSQPPVFTITYWGVTGTFCAPLLPRQVTKKLTDAIQTLVEKDRLSHLHAGPGLRESIEQLIQEELPFAQRSSYGGNTTCVELQTPDTHIILDCGSGFLPLGASLEARWKAKGDIADRTAHVLLTHSHMDHTFATPFFKPYYNKLNAFTIWGPQIALDSLAAVLDAKSALSQVYFPPTYNEMTAIRGFHPLLPGTDFTLGSTRITTYALNHPGGSMAYRFENAGRVFVFATDHEQQETPDPGLMEFARNADLLYTEGQYTMREYLGEVGVANDLPIARRGWGHTPVEWCVTTAVAANVRRLHIGHSDPRRDDYQLAEFDAYLKSILSEELRRANRPESDCEGMVPYEGLQIHL